MSASRDRIHRITAQATLLLVAVWQFSVWLTPGIANEGISPAKQISQPKEAILSNGLKVLILEDGSYPVVSCAMWYRTGARNDRIGRTGVAHLVEHLLFKDVGSFKGDSMQTAIIRNGGEFNGYTSDDFTVFYETLPASKLELALKIESERMSSAAFNEKDVQDEIVRITKEFEPGVQDELELLEREVKAASFKQHPYHNPARGWLSDVKSLTLGDAQNFYSTYYRPDNATLVIAGGVNSDAAVAMVENYFGKIACPDVPIPEVKFSEGEQFGERRITVRYKGGTNLVQLAYHAPALSRDEAAACAVLEQHFNAAVTGVLKSAVLDKKLCTKATAAFESKKDPGLFTITCYLKPGVGIESVLGPLDKAINEIRTETLSDDELSCAKNLAEFEFGSDRDGPYTAAFQIGFFDSLDKWNAAYDWSGKIHQVKADDLQRIASRVLDPNRRVVGHLINGPAPKPVAAASSKNVTASRQLGMLHSKLCAYKEDSASPAFTVADSEKHAISLAVENAEGVITGKQVVVDAPINPVLGKKPAAAAVARVPARATPRKSVSVFSPAITERILSNGTKLIVFENHLSPVVEVRGAVRAGSSFDPKGKDGLSQLTTFLLNSGSDDTDTSSMQEKQELMGMTPSAMLKFSNDPETIRFKTRCLSRHFGPQMEVLAEILTDPNRKDNSIRYAREALRKEVGKQQSNLYKRIDRTLKASLLLKGSPYIPDNLTALSASIGRLTEKDLDDFDSRFMRPESTVIVVSGDISAAEAARKLEEAFEDWRPSGEPPLFPPTKRNKRQIRRTSLPVEDKSQGVISFGQLLPVAQTSQEYGQILVADCLLANHPMMSRFDQLLAGDEVLSQDIRNDSFQAGLSDLGHSTLWSLKLTLPQHLIPYALDSINTELRKITREGVNAREVAEARRYLLGAVPVKKMSSLSSSSTNILESTIAGGDANFIADVLIGIRTSSVASVNKVIRKKLKPARASLVIAADGETLRAVRKHSLALKKAAAGSSGRSRQADNLKPAGGPTSAM